MNWRARGQRVLTESPFTLQQQVVSWSGQQWQVECTLPPMGLVQAEQWVSWALALDGPVHYFELGDQANPDGQGTRSGTVLTNGATAVGDKTLAVDGLTASLVDAFKAGDWLRIASGSNRQLFKVLQDSTANGSGECTLDVWPFLRFVFADNHGVSYSSPTGYFRMQTGIVDWTVENLIYGFSFTAIEVV